MHAQAEIVAQAFALLGPDGRFIRVTNALTSPLPRAELDLAGTEATRIWLNFLPAQIRCYRPDRRWAGEPRRRGGDGSRHAAKE